MGRIVVGQIGDDGIDVVRVLHSARGVDAVFDDESQGARRGVNLSRSAPARVERTSGTRAAGLDCRLRGSALGQKPPAGKWSYSEPDEMRVSPAKLRL
jgi:hypothetical protein